MQQFDFGVGSIVKFKDKVYAYPYSPHYDLYLGQTFQIVAFHEGNHIELQCLSSPSIKVAGYVHEDELEYSDL